MSLLKEGTLFFLGKMDNTEQKVIEAALEVITKLARDAGALFTIEFDRKGYRRYGQDSFVPVPELAALSDGNFTLLVKCLHSTPELAVARATFHPGTSYLVRCVKQPENEEASLGWREKAVRARKIWLSHSDEREAQSRIRVAAALEAIGDLMEKHGQEGALHFLGSGDQLCYCYIGGPIRQLSALPPMRDEELLSVWQNLATSASLKVDLGRNRPLPRPVICIVRWDNAVDAEQQRKRAEADNDE